MKWSLFFNTVGVGLLFGIGLITDDADDDDELSVASHANIDPSSSSCFIASFC